jgi:hypothetical protein
MYYPNFEGSGWIYDILNKHGYKMLHIMGDSDGLCTTKGLWDWIRKTGWKTTKPWSPCMMKDKDGEE